MGVWVRKIVRRPACRVSDSFIYHPGPTHNEHGTAEKLSTAQLTTDRGVLGIASSSQSKAVETDSVGDAAKSELTHKMSFSFSFAAPTSSSLAKSSTNTENSVAPHNSTVVNSRPHVTDPGSPMKLTSPSKQKATSQRLSQAKSNSKSGSSATTGMPTSSVNPKSNLTSPTKSSLARAASTIIPLSSTKSGTVSVSATSRGPSSLSNLANALEKLRMPHPVRPNSTVVARPSTSMGFNRDVDESEDNNGKGKGRAVDDEAVGKASSVGIGRLNGTLRRAATLGSESFGAMIEDPASTVMPEANPVSEAPPLLPSASTTGAESSAAASSIQASSSSTPKVAEGTSGKNTITAWMKAGSSRSTPMGTGSSASTKPRIFMAGTRTSGNRVGNSGGFPMGRGRAAQKVSRNPGLPSVVGSPTKGGDKESAMDLDDDDDSRDVVGEDGSRDADVFIDIAPVSEAVLGGDKDEGREKDSALNAWKWNASRRASLASRALSQSLSELPPVTKTKSGLMGPPEVPARLGGMKSASTTSAVSGSRGVRSSSRIMAMASALGKAKSVSEIDSPAVKDVRQKSTKEEGAAGSLDVMKDCTVFVDVRTDDGDDAGGLFAQMLRDMGARVGLLRF